MKKLQQFKVLSITFDRLKNANFNLTLDVPTAIINNEIIELADSEVLRAIRRLTNHPFSSERLLELQKENRQLQKSDDITAKSIIAKNIKEIGKLLFIPEYISVHTPKKSQYPIIGENGFFVNGIKYVRLLCGAAHARTNRTMFCKETIWTDLVNLLCCGAKPTKLLSAKWNTYFALASTATHRVSSPIVAVVKDCEIFMDKEVEWIDDDDNISTQTRNLKFNLFDGMGLISPSFAKFWADEIELNYTPSTFVIRCAFIKGMVAVFDFHKFAEEVARKKYITDIYGNLVDIRNVDVILTESQFKLWNAYDNWEEYETNIRNNNFSWGIAKISPKIEKNFMRTNYQFLQALKLSDDDIKNLCLPTINWIKNIKGGDWKIALLYLLGKIAKNDNPREVWEQTRDSFVRALMLDSELINDDYILNRLSNSLAKRIKESYIGKLLIRGNFQTMVSDPYALCEHIFGLEIKGLLKDGEHFSNYWNDLGVKKLAGMRSPLTWVSEVNILNLIQNNEVCEWYKYIQSGIIYNVWGSDCMLSADSDFDGDIVATTDNEFFIKGKQGSIPITYETHPAQKEEINFDKLYLADQFGYNSQIGFITNCNTTLDEMRSMYDSDSKEYAEIIKRRKLCRKFQGLEIDKAKGLKVKSFPTSWTQYNKSMTELDKKLVINKRPFFMRYNYKHYNKKYKEFIDEFDLLSYSKWGCKWNDIDEKIKKTDEFKEIEQIRSRKNPFLESNGIMNKICHFMFENLGKSTKSSNSLYDELIFNKNNENELDLLSKMIELYGEYWDFRRSKMLQESNFASYNQFNACIREKAMTTISSDISLLADLAVIVSYKHYPKKPKDFAWDCFGDMIVENLVNKNKIAIIPCQNGIGDVEYLYENYDFVEIDVTDTLANENFEIDFNFIADEDFE